MNSICRLLYALLLTTIATPSIAIKYVEAIWTEEDSTLTYVYDDIIHLQGESFNGKIITQVDGDWLSQGPTNKGVFPFLSDRNYCEFVRTIIIDESFKDAPYGLRRGLFSGGKNVTAIQGLENANMQLNYDFSGLFSGCSSLSSIDLSSLNTEKVVDMGGMFANCSSLTSLDLSSLKTDNVLNMAEMFANCSSLTSLDVSKLKTDKVVFMNHLFSGCSNLTCIDISTFNTENVKEIQSMFSDCSRLTKIDFGNFHTENVKYFSKMFSGCSSLVYLDLSCFNTCNALSFYLMFWGCSQLKMLNLSGFSTENVTDIGGMFNSCVNLTSLDLSSFDTKNITNISYAFLDCYNLKNICLGRGFKIETVKGQFVFEGVSDLKVYVNEEIRDDIETSLKRCGFSKEMGTVCSKETITATITNGSQYWTTYFNSVASMSFPEEVEAFTAKVHDGSIVLDKIKGMVIPKGNAVLLKSCMSDMTLKVDTIPYGIITNNDLKGVDNKTFMDGQEELIYALAVSNGTLGFLDDGREAISAHEAYISHSVDITDFLPIEGEQTDFTNNTVVDGGIYDHPKRNQMVLGYYRTNDLCSVYSGAGGPNAGVYKACVRFTKEQMLPFVNNDIVNIRFGLVNTNISNVKVWLSRGRDTEYIYSQDVPAYSTGWNEIALSSPFRIMDDSLYVGIEYYQDKKNYPVSYYDYGGESGSVCIYGPFNGSDQESVWRDVNTTGSLSIQCLVEGNHLPLYDIHTTGVDLYYPYYFKAGEQKNVTLLYRDWGKRNHTQMEIASYLDGVFLSKSTRYRDKSVLITETSNVGVTIPESTPPGWHQLTLKVTSINGQPVEFPVDDEQTSNIPVYVHDMGRTKVLLEHYTGTWCIHCPETDKQIENQMKNGKDIVLVSYHLGDELSCEAGEEYASSFGVYTIPQKGFNRYASLGKDYIGAISYEYARKTPSFADVHISASYQESNRMLDIIVNGNRNEDFLPIEKFTYLTVLLTENDVEYPQHGLSGVTTDYKHQGVLRANVSEIWGDSVVWDGDVYEMHYKVKLDESWNKDNMNIVAFLGKPFTGSNHDQIAVVNCNELAVRKAAIVETIKEDVNNDGLLNIADVITILKTIRGVENNCQADVNGDGIVNYADVQVVVSSISERK